MDLSWMAWTWQTACFFLFVFASIIAMGIWEYFKPGGSPRRGILGLHTTRGDRLFVTYLGAGFIFLAWMFFFGSLMWSILIVMILYAIWVFLYV